MNSRGKIAVTSLLAVLGAALGVQAQEKSIKMEELPPAVQETVATQSKVATVRGFSTATVSGQQVYEVDMTAGGHDRNISMDPQGNIVAVKEEIAIGTLSATVQDGLKRAAVPGTIIKVESLTKKGKLVAYEAIVKSGPKHIEIQVGLDGKKLAHVE